MPQFGEKSRFAIRVGDYVQPTCREVEIWAGGEHLTCDESASYLPYFCHVIERSIGCLLASDSLKLPFPGLQPDETHRRLNQMDDEVLRLRYRFFDWAETTDNFHSYLFRGHDDVALTFEFWRPSHHKPADIGRVFVVGLKEREFLWVLQGAVSFLRSTSFERPGNFTGGAWKWE